MSYVGEQNARFLSRAIIPKGTINDKVWPCQWNLRYKTARFGLGCRGRSLPDMPVRVNLFGEIASARDQLFDPA